MGLMGLSGERGAARRGCAPPPPLVRIGLGEGGRRPPFLLFLPLPFPLLVGVGNGGERYREERVLNAEVP